jgi:hypothetical protein
MLPPLVLAAGYAGTLELSETSEVRGRINSTPADVAVDFLEQPQLRARVTDRRWDFDFSYTPSLTLPDLQGGVDPQFFETGSTGLAWHDRLVRVAFTESLTHGTINSAFLTTLTPGAPATAGGTAPTTLQPAAPPGLITILSTTTAAAVSARIDRRSSLSVDGAFTRSGGLDEHSQQFIPEQRGLNAGATFSSALSRRDRTMTSVRALGTDFGLTTCPVATTLSTTPTIQCMPQDRLIQATQAIQHSVQRATTLGMSAGLSVSWSRLDRASPYRIVPYPIAGTFLTHRFGERGADMLEFDTQLAPAIDTLSGQVSQRVQGQLTLTEPLDNRTTLSAFASALQTIPGTDPPDVTMVGGGVEVGELVKRGLLRVAVGSRAAWQSDNIAGGSFFSALLYLDVTVFAPTLRY